MSREFTVLFAVAAGILSVVGVVALVVRLLRRTIWQRPSKLARLRKLRATAHLAYFTSLLGPFRIRRSLSPELNESVYVDRDYYVQTVSDRDDRVLVYSVTSRSRRFRPKVPFPGGGMYSVDQEAPLRVTLHKTRLAFSDVYQPIRIIGHCGARRSWYSEIYYFGNPGGYQCYALSVNDAAPVFGNHPWDVLQPFGELSDENQAEFLDSPSVRAFRSTTSPNTYSVSAPDFGIFDGSIDPAVLGVDADAVRVLDD